MLKIIASIIVVLIVCVLGFAATKPDSFRYDRSIVINAPAAKIFAILNDLHRGIEWSPFEQMDPEAKRTFTGAKTGKGSIYQWDGNSDAGAGSLEILETTPSKNITLKLDFTRPFKATNTVEFNLAPKDGGTEVTWSMYGPNTYMGKLVSVFMDCEKMITESFDQGLTNLKTLAEK